MWKSAKPALVCAALLLGAGCASNQRMEKQQRLEVERQQRQQQEQAEARQQQQRQQRLQQKQAEARQREAQERQRLEERQRQEDARRQAEEAAARRAREQTPPPVCQENLTLALAAAGVDAMIPDCFGDADWMTCLLDVMPLSKALKVARFLAQVGAGAQERSCRE